MFIHWGGTYESATDLPMPPELGLMMLRPNLFQVGLGEHGV